MRRLLQYLGHRLYTTWATFWFAFPFLVTYPLQWLLSQRLEWLPYLHALNRGWSKLFIFLWGMPVTIVRKQLLPAGQPCVYVPNHSSYIDIPLLFKAIPGHLNVMGKTSLTKVPLWGPIFKRSYISVDRSSTMGRARSVVQARQSLAAGRSIIIFPEGTIGDRPGEELLPFKDGPFQLAIAAGVPLVPVTMSHNHRFLPDVGGLRVRYSPLRIVLHAPIPTQGLTAADIPALKERVRCIIASEFDPAAAGLPAPSTWRRTPPAPADAPARPTSVKQSA